MLSSCSPPAPERAVCGHQSDSEEPLPCTLVSSGAPVPLWLPTLLPPPPQLTMPDFMLWDRHCRFWGTPVDEIGSMPPGERKAAWALMSMASHTTCWRWPATPTSHARPSHRCWCDR